VIADWQRVTHRLLALVEAELGDLGLSPAETNVLACLSADDPPAIRRVSEATAQPPSTLTGLLDRLERRGLVERRPNPRDRRSTLVVLTPDGGSAARRVSTAFREVEARIPEAARTAVAGLLADIEGALDA
jgi:MarR family transcriptional regulator, organic hydroperoxide resistance regulator